jgi:hypothetical protein
VKSNSQEAHTIIEAFPNANEDNMKLSERGFLAFVRKRRQSRWLPLYAYIERVGLEERE